MQLDRSGEPGEGHKFMVSRSFENVTNLDRLIETVTEGKPHKVTFGSSQVTIDVFEAGINFAADVSDAVGAINAMGKLHLVAQRTKELKTKLDAEGDKMLAKLDSIDAAAPAAFANAHAVIDSQKSDIENMESELKQISNLPEA